MKLTPREYEVLLQKGEELLNDALKAFLMDRTGQNGNGLSWGDQMAGMTLKPSSNWRGEICQIEYFAINTTLIIMQNGQQVRDHS